MNPETNDEVKKDLANLKIDSDSLDNLTGDMVKAAYYKTALLTHPDKADPADAKQVEEFTAAFQELGNSYQRILQYLIENEGDNIEAMKDEQMRDEALLAKEIFDKFNVPHENKGSFTVRVEDKLADLDKNV